MRKQEAYFENGSQYTIGICRDNKLRWRDIDGKGLAIMELRDDQNPLSHEHPALENLLLLAGAQYGLHYNREAHYKDNVSKAEFSSKRTFTGDEKLFFTKEILNLASVGEDGKLVFENKNRLRRDLNKYMSFLTQELSLKPKEDLSLVALSKWFESLHLNAEQTAITPQDVSAVSADPARTEETLAGLHFGAEVHRIRNKDGYTVNLSDEKTGEPYYPGSDDKQRYVHFMAESQLLKKVLNPALFQDILNAYAGLLNMQPPKVPGLRRE
jgi:hypothetical protein